MKYLAKKKLSPHKKIFHQKSVISDSWARTSNEIFHADLNFVYLGGVHNVNFTYYVVKFLAFFYHLHPYVMAIGVVEFSREGYKIRKVFA